MYTDASTIKECPMHSSRGDFVAAIKGGDAKGSFSPHPYLTLIFERRGALILLTYEEGHRIRKHVLSAPAAVNAAERAR
jgi:hypothetical protein